MALDGIVISNLVYELNHTILDAKISKIAQPEDDELLLTFKSGKGQYRLLLSASASLPFVYLTQENKTAPLTAPTFCMVLRKHIANGRLVKIFQPDMERIIRFEFEHLDELGDLCKKSLIVELMGKHSNIIFCKEDGTIIDSIKHVPCSMSSVREVLPGRDYFIPATQEKKKNPLETDTETFLSVLRGKPCSVTKAIYSSFVGISPLIASEIAFRSGMDGDLPVASYTDEELCRLAGQFQRLMEDIRLGQYTPVIIRNGREPIEFSSVRLQQYADYQTNSYDSVSKVLEVYYAERNAYVRIRQKSTELRRITATALERCQKKFQLQQKQFTDAQKREKYRIYGELLQTYGYGLPEGTKELTAENYYDNNRPIRIPLDPRLTPLENAQKYFDRYGKLKRTSEAVSELLTETRHEIEHLESIQNALDIALTADDLVQIREELVEYGFIRKGKGGRTPRVKSKPFHYRSSDGYDIYVGKNNYQNEEITFKLATGNDWWFHAKGIPGSHVVVKSNNEELPDRVFEEAGRLAGYYSKGRNSDKLEIDYLQKKNVKKPKKSAPGFVVYYTNYSLTIHPDITGIEQIEE